MTLDVLRHFVFDLQNIFIQTHQSRLTEYQIEIFQGLRHPKALTLIQLLGPVIDGQRYICDSRMRNLGLCCVVDGLEHAPCGIGE